ncbi:MAG: amino acid adenylation domain-containing protein, partial [bacterium]|nr:amino acid adenylation domain-containing protein [bacterium]
VIERHPILRSTFVEVDGEPLQRIAARRDFALSITDARGWSAAALRAAVNREVARPLDLRRGPVARGHLYAVSPPAVERGEWVLVLTAHHVVMDLWSMAVVLDELRVVYAALCAGEEPSLRPAPHYLDFVRRQEEMLAGSEGERLWRFWTRQLAGDPTPTELPPDRPRPAVRSFRGATAWFEIAAPAAGELMSRARVAGATPFQALLAAFLVLVGRYCGKTDLQVGTATAGRTRAPFRRLVGCCVNPVVLRAELAADPSFDDLLVTARHMVREALRHQSLPFPLLVERLQPIRDPSRSPLAQILFLLQKPVRIPEAGAFLLGHPEARLELGGMTLRPFPTPQPGAQFDLTMTLAPLGDGFAGTLQYSTDLFDPTTMKRLARHFEQLLGNLAAQPQRPISAVPLASRTEAHQLLVEWNDTSRPPGRRCDAASVHELFAARAAAIPEAIAVESAGARLSYAELRTRADRLSLFLARRGVGPETRVGICVERSPEMVVALLGILAAGAAYVPLDPTSPPERLALMIADAGVAVVLTEEALRDRLPGDAELVCLPLPAAGPDRGRPAPRCRAENLAWVLYTSGSTGRPKAVAVTHRSAVVLLRWADEVFSAEELRAVLAATSISWDLSAFELFVPLCRGGKVILAPNVLELPELPAAGEVTLVNTVPSAMAALLRGSRLPPAVRAVNLAGEPLSRELVERLYARGTVTAVRNLYGPSEDTTYSTWALIRRGEEHRSPTIGRPVGQTRAYVLDRRLRPVPPGAPGELCLGGRGLARGYLNRPGLTAERFVPDPWSHPTAGGRLYRTGDLARRRPDGHLEFLGRMDEQVKIRGFRIEPAEIEATLASHPEVVEAAVVARAAEGSELRLAAYLVNRSPTAARPRELRTFLGDRLPPYMLPSIFVFLRALPRTRSGKLDRRALPAPSAERPPAGAPVAPRSRMEQTLAAIWRRVLGLDEVGVDDNFFDLGGHSLLVAKVRSELRTELGHEVAMVDLFRHPTIRGLARHLHGPADAAPARGPATRRRVLAGDSAIAIIGMGGRFPGTSDLEAFWRNLRSGTESVSFFSPRELEQAGVPPELSDDPRYVPARGVLKDIDLFDAGFFGFSPHQAEITDPQHRLFLECAWEALEDAGYDPERFPGPIGVFAGARPSRYALALRDGCGARPVDDYGILVATGGDFLSTQVSYRLNLLGPSINVQNACSTSLVAVHLGCQSLLTGECDLALAGGVAIAVPQRTGYLFQQGGIGSPDGHCRAFDAGARGTVGGNGLGIVVLKRRREALADGDRVHAVILGSAINNDGAGKVGYTAPSVDGQAAVIRDALATAGVDARSITYVEAHGTGTPLGDPIEVAALTQAFREASPAPSVNGERFCALGSVKTNLGHLDPASGIAGLIKTVLALEHREIPPSLHFREANPEIDFASGPFFVNAELRPWTADAGPRRAGVSSFGIGGTNVHAVVEEAPPREAPEASHRPQLLVVSAKTDTALETMTDRLAAHLRELPAAEADGHLADVAFTLQVGRAVFEHRRMLVARDRDDACVALESRDPRRVLSRRRKAKDRPLAFLFPGQGAQYVNMGRGLYESEPVFRDQVDRCAELLRPALGRDLRGVLFPPAGSEAEAAAELARTALTQPALFVVEYALARLWIGWGVRPQALLGHSLGEYVAATLAGVFRLEDALALVALRARLIQALPPGAMLSIPRPAEELAERLRPYRDEAAVAAINGPAQTVVAGAPAAIEGLAAALAADGVSCRRLAVSHAFHSPLLAPVAEPLAAALAGIPLRPPAITYLSNLSGDWITAAEATDPEYWIRQLLEPVRFADGVARLLADSDTAFLEVGPGRQLGTLVRRQAGRGAGPVLLSSLVPSGSVVEGLWTTLGKLWLAGVAVDWPALHAGERRRRVSLPTYPFERRRYWLESTVEAAEVPARQRPRKAPELRVAELHPRPQLDTAYVAPADPCESAIAEIWQELLGVDRVGVHDNFFELGGDSLLATRILSRVHRRLGVEVSPEELYDTATVAELAALARGAGKPPPATYEAEATDFEEGRL